MRCPANVEDEADQRVELKWTKRNADEAVDRFLGVPHVLLEQGERVFARDAWRERRFQLGARSTPSLVDQMPDTHGAGTTAVVVRAQLKPLQLREEIEAARGDAHVTYWPPPTPSHAPCSR
jgi:hypothetical protein